MCFLQCEQDKFLQGDCPAGDVIIFVSKFRFLYSRWKIFYLKSFFWEAACAATKSNNVFWSVYEILFIFSRAFSKKDSRQWEFVRNHRESSGAIKERCAYEPPQLTSITIKRRKKGLWCASPLLVPPTRILIHVVSIYAKVPRKSRRCEYLFETLWKGLQRKRSFPTSKNLARCVNNVANKFNTSKLYFYYILRKDSKPLYPHILFKIDHTQKVIFANKYFQRLHIYSFFNE